MRALVVFLHCLGVFVAVIILTGAVRRIAVAKQLLDIPNARSSHAVATPRGGGLAIVLGSALGFTILAVQGFFALELTVTLLVGGGAVALIGLIDDRYGLSARPRLVVHTIAACWAVFWLDPPMGGQSLGLAAIGTVLLVIGVVWMINLFNFMDGIDGIASSEALFASGAFGAFLWFIGDADVALASFVFAAACAGFLCWNWPPAKIFMGDIGSGYLGYILAALVLAAMREHPVLFFSWIILVGAFVVDATVTLLVRALRRERIFQAHRSHAYQRLTRSWGGHAQVTLRLWGLNLLWLLPLSLIAMRAPSFASWVALIALLPLTILVLAVGGGRAD